MDREQLTCALIKNLKEQGAEVYQAGDLSELHLALARVLSDGSMSRLCTGKGGVLDSLDLEALGRETHTAVFRTSDFTDRDQYKQTVFDVDAGLSSVDYAVAESGTLVIRHGKKNPRLLSLAPLTHLAIVTPDCIVPVYEDVIRDLAGTCGLPSQLTFITGPSMTADIMATPFRGMHGPKRLVVFILSAWISRESSQE